MKRKTTLHGWDGERNTVPELPEEPKRAPTRKDTKRWCRGKVGVPHVWEWVRDERRDFGRFFGRGRTPDNAAWWTERCATCLRQRGYCTGAFGACICGRHARGKSNVE